MRIFLVLLCLTIMGTFLTNANNLIAAEEQSGFVTAIEGDVRVYRLPVSTGKSDIPGEAVTARWEGKDYKAFKAKLYGKVYEGDVIVTGDGSKAKLVMSGSNTLVVGALTNFIIKTAKDLGNNNSNSAFKILYGKIRSVVKSKLVGEGKYEVSTPSSVIGVRGTDFYAVYTPQDGKTTVSTLEGVVAVSNLAGKIKKEVLVESGYSTTVVSLAGIDIAKMKDLKKAASLKTVPTAPTKVKSVDLNQIKDVSTIETELNKIDVDIKNMKAAKDSEQHVLDIIKTKNSAIDTSKDPLNREATTIYSKAIIEALQNRRKVTSQRDLPGHVVDVPVTSELASKIEHDMSKEYCAKLGLLENRREKRKKESRARSRGRKEEILMTKKVSIPEGFRFVFDEQMDPNNPVTKLYYGELLPGPEEVQDYTTD